MYPMFKRGDYVFSTDLNTHKNEISVVGMYQINKTLMPIVHRVVETHKNETSFVFLSKGDNNNRTDEWAYGDDFLNYSKLSNDLIAVVPYIGYPNLWLREHPSFFILFIFYVGYFSIHY